MKMKNIRKVIIITIICFLISSCITSSFAFQNYDKNETIATCYLFKHNGMTSTEKVISYETGTYLVELFKKSNDDSSKKAELISTLIDLGFIQDNSYVLKNPNWVNKWKPIISSTTGTNFFCSIASGGAGKTTPIILLPRPRAFLSWVGDEDYEFPITMVGSLRENKGFFAYGNQQGIAIGFVGLGLTYGTPLGPIYGFTGYALYTSVTADDIEFYPPNRKPQISSPNPSNNEENVPLTLSELSFRIDDADNDLLSYSVITDPDIGSENKNNRGNGFYSIPVNGLQHSTTYSWTVSVTDGKDVSDKTYTFTTENLAPVITNSYPIGMYVSIDTSELQFTITDYQGDLMDYSVETSPYIGSKYDTGVISASYTTPISGLISNMMYTWYVNVTDGNYWTREKFVFSTDEAELVAYWSFDEGSGSVFYDESGNGNHGIITGGSFADGISGTALSLDGINDYADATDFDIDDDFSISLWINPSSTEYQQAFLGKHTSNADNLILIGYYESDGPYKGYSFNIRDNAYREGIITTDWQHLVYVGKKINPSLTNVIVYKDGELLWVHDLNSIVGDVSGKPWTIGQDWDWSTPRTDFFNGLIDEIKIFNGIINQKEIEELYLNHKGVK
jgi:hypothetical protein